MRFGLIAILATAALAANAADAGVSDAVQKGRLIFQTHCALCHDDSEHMLNDSGPALYGVVGRPVGSVPGYDYSQALKDANLHGDRWTEGRLDALNCPSHYGRGPNGVYGGTAMPMNFSKVEDRKAIIAYLKTLKPR